MSIIYETRTAFHQVRVEDNYPIRKLLFGHGLCSEQTGINLEEPHKHVFDYSALAMHSLLMCPDPKSVLIIGLGGGFIPMEVQRYTNGSVIDVIEIDPEIKTIAEKYFSFQESERIKVHIGDAFQVIQTMPRKYDFAVIDAFDSSYIPFHLMSCEFFKMVYDVLGDDGFASVNMSCIHPSFSSQVNTIKSVFGDNLLFLHGSRNPISYMLFALKHPMEILSYKERPFCHFLGVKPPPIPITEEIKNAPIFSLHDRKTV